MTLAAIEPPGPTDARPARRRRGREEIVKNEPTKRIRYGANACAGDFSQVRERPDTWKRESLTCRPERRLFAGKDEVREPNPVVYEGPASAQRARVARSVRACRAACRGRAHDVARDGGLRRVSGRMVSQGQARRLRALAAPIDTRGPPRRSDMNTPSMLHRPEPTPDVEPDPAWPEHDDPVDPPVPAGPPQGDPPSHPPPMRMPGGGSEPQPARDH